MSELSSVGEDTCAFDASRPAFPALEIDVGKYREYIRDLNLAEDQEAELIKATWNLMMAFVDIGFGIHPVQRALAERQLDEFACGEPGETRDGGPLALRDVLESLINKSDDVRELFNGSSAPVQV